MLLHQKHLNFAYSHCKVHHHANFSSICVANQSVNRNPDHIALYIKWCNKLNIPPTIKPFPSHQVSLWTMGNSFASIYQMFLMINSSLRLVQGSLDGIVTQKLCLPTFLTAGLLDYIIELIVEKDEVSTLYVPFSS